MKKIKAVTLRSLLFCVLLVSLSSCSVIMASNKSGTGINTVQAANTRGQIIATGAATIINTETDSKGNTIETYKIQKEKGSIARAVMHGILDISSFGIWEAFGIPIEVVLNKKEYFAVRITYDKSGTITKKELI